jgi:hypothetical protein
LGYAAGTGKKDTSKAVLLSEDVAEALREVRGEDLSRRQSGLK